MPFECVCMDFFKLEGWQYLVMVDRFSGWCEVKRAKVGTDTAGSRGLITAMRGMFGTFGVPREVSSDGEGPFTADETKDFYERWGIDFQLSSAYHPSSNGRAELGVKSMKRLLQGNIGPDGTLDTDKFLRAILTHRNTPDQLSRKSPSEVIFGRKLRDTLPVFEGTRSVFEDDKVLPLWREGWSLKERALRTRAARTVETLSKHSRDLPPLRHGDLVSVQNQTGPHPTRWDRTAVVMECLPHNQYTVKIDATGRLTLRNRQFLRKYTPTPGNVIVGVPVTHNEPVLEAGVGNGSPNLSASPAVEVGDNPPEQPIHTDNSVEREVQSSATPALSTSRRSGRTRKEALVYEPETGKYVQRTG